MRDGRVHDARHTAATGLLLLGVHERTIMSILGWSTTAMVSRYAHVVEPIHTDVARRLDDFLWSSEPGPGAAEPKLLYLAMCGQRLVSRRLASGRERASGRDRGAHVSAVAGSIGRSSGPIRWVWRTHRVRIANVPTGPHDDDLKNPAIKLWELLSAWQTTPAGNSVLEHRAVNADWWSQELKAIMLFEQVQEEAEFQYREDPNLSAEMIPVLEACQQAIFAVGTAMGSASQGDGGILRTARSESCDCSAVPGSL